MDATSKPNKEQVRPATPLPWVAHQNQRFGYAIRDAKGGNVANRACSNNAAYIVAACNAYPRLLAERAELVAALRTVAPIIERFAAEADPQNSVLDQRRDDLRALLRRIEGAE